MESNDFRECRVVNRRLGASREGPATRVGNLGDGQPYGRVETKSQPGFENANGVVAAKVGLQGACAASVVL